MKVFSQIRLFLLYHYCMYHLRKLQYVCEFIGNTCFVNREVENTRILCTDKGRYVKNAGQNGCCQTCEHLDENRGCTYRNLTCSAIFCKPAYEDFSNRDKARFHKIHRIIEREGFVISLRERKIGIKNFMNGVKKPLNSKR